MGETPSGYRQHTWQVGIVVALLASICLWISFQFIEPIPPRQIVLASGPESSLYHGHAQRYKESLARHGVTVIERITEGAGENLRLLGDPSSGVDIGFVQGGQAGTPEAKGVVMLASLYYQPLWIFVRRGERIDSLAALAGKTIGMGMPGSGTNTLGAPLLAANGVTESNAKLVRIPTDRTRLAVQTGEIDVALIVGGVRTPAVTEALTAPTLELVSLAHADAYPQRYPYLSRRTLYTGAISFVPTVPSRDVALITTEAMLAARDTVHPAIVNLLLETIRDEHDDQGYFRTPGEFPNVDQVDLPVSLDAVRHKRFGPSHLYRYLPFWVAAFVERFIIIVLPLLVVVVPVVQRLPQFLNWRARSRIYRWYGELTLLEREVELKRGTLPIEKWLADLDRIERAAEHIKTPASFASESYTLREHINLVRRTVLTKAGGSSPARTLS
ncbi:MAG: C4-dicarboxylate transporter substrate-binding protein [candidate division NC10 bacterium]|nr:C4-dicarboxylate transporter substrate-binding protein [candidate division NC10 bacterium]